MHMTYGWHGILYTNQTSAPQNAFCTDESQE